MFRFLPMLLLAVGLSLPGLATGRYVAGIEDVPLMPALEPADGGATFDSPLGRIVVAFARGAARREDTLTFYARSLPQLGWVRLDELTFRRDAETLRIDFGGTDGNLTVRFTIAPAP